MAEQTINIINKKGLHARASAKFVSAVARLPDNVTVTVEKSGQAVAGSSIMGLMMLGAAQGDTVTVKVDGPDADIALKKLLGLIMDGFGED